ncbi:MAG: lysylphosphatidylglycerol synthase transmembrane domain-containing protein, partial [Bdellovibrionota bacterium]
IITWLLMSGKIDLYAIRYVLTPKSILICWGALFISFFLVSVRWQTLIASQGIYVSTKDSIKLSLIGSFFSFVLPGGVSGDAVKAYYVSKNETNNQNSKQWSSWVSVIVDRYIGITTLCGIAFLVTLFDYERLKVGGILSSLQTFLGLILIVLIILGYLIFSKKRYSQMGRLFRRLDIKFGEKAVRFFDALHGYGHPGVLAKTSFLSVMGHVVVICIFAHLGEKMGEAIPIEAYYYCVPIAMMLSSVPIAPGGIGVGQAAYYFVFNVYLGHVSDIGPTLVTIYQLIIFSYSLAGAFFYLQLKKTTNLSLEQK